MNRLRHAYLKIAPALDPYFTTGHHDGERGLATTYMLDRPTQARLWLQFLVNTLTIVATVDAALAAVIVVLIMQAAEAPTAALVAGGVVAFLTVWGTFSPCSATRCTRYATRRRGSSLRRMYLKLQSAEVARLPHYLNPS